MFSEGDERRLVGLLEDNGHLALLAQELAELGGTKTGMLSRRLRDWGTPYTRR